MAQYGYCRVSNPKQHIERQVRNIEFAYPDAVIIKEVHTRTSFESRDKWNKLVKMVRPEDVIIFDSVSRMSGNEEEGIAAYMDLYGRGVELVFLNEPHINTATYKAALNRQIALTGTNVDKILSAINDYLIDLAKDQIRLAFAQSEKEVMDLRKRTRGGIETARLEGKQIGRIKGRKYETQKSREKKQYILHMAKCFGGTMADGDIIAALGIARNTYYKYKRELQEESINNSTL